MEFDKRNLRIQAQWTGPIRIINLNRKCAVRECKKKAPESLGEAEAISLRLTEEFTPNNDVMKQQLLFRVEVKTSKLLCLVHRAFWKLSK